MVIKEWLGFLCGVDAGETGPNLELQALYGECGLVYLIMVLIRAH